MPPSSSDSDSSVFGQFNDDVRRWVWKQKWTQLRGIQERAAIPILEGNADVIVAAPTAGGKTEAAFLPIASRLADTKGEGIGCLCISPLKALINDQADRLTPLFEHVSLPMTAWHGDISASRKDKFLRKKSGLLLITPESLEALFVLRGAQIPGLFSGLSYVVVDELHSFIGAERGRQLESLLNRVELAIRRRVPRIALSATLGDMGLAAEFLRPGHGSDVIVVEGASDSQELRIQLRGYKSRSPKGSEDGEDSEDDTGEALRLTGDLLEVLRGNDNLVFANSRRRVEELTDQLRRMCDSNSYPNEFFPHHGNLSREIREEAETRVKDRSKPTSVICTSTLELGVDIGSVTSVAQVGSPPSVSSLRQRLGRSGREEGQPAILRIFITENEISSTSTVLDELRAQTFQSVAMVQLLLARWCEPPAPHQLHLSTMVQQVMSIIAQHGGASAGDLHSALCVSGPFRRVDSALFGEVLRGLGEHQILTQVSGGELTLGTRGEKLVGHYSFYAAFQTPEEYRLVAGGKTLGSMPVDGPLLIGCYLIFAGRRWEIRHVDDTARVVELAAARGGRPPRFDGGGFEVHDRIRNEMFRMYSSSTIPIYLDEKAKELLSEGRAAFTRRGLSSSGIVDTGGSVALFPWVGDRALHTMALQLGALGFAVSIEGVSLGVRGSSVEKVLAGLKRVVAGRVPTGSDLASGAENQIEEKYDWALSAEARNVDYASRHLDEDGAQAAATRILDLAPS